MLCRRLHIWYDAEAINVEIAAVIAVDASKKLISMHVPKIVCEHDIYFPLMAVHRLSLGRLGIQEMQHTQ